MRLKTKLLLLLALTGAPLLQATAPLYSVKIGSTQSFELIPEANTSDRLDLYPMTEMEIKGSRKVVADGYATGLAKIKTGNPSIAIQDIFKQIGQQTGLMLRIHLDSTLSSIAPVTIMTAFSEIAVITLVLTPKEPGVFQVTCSYVLDARPAGSTDGTAAATAQMEEALRLLTADSTATSLPVKTALQDIKPGEYFRGAMKYSEPDENGGFFPAVALILKKGNDYTLGVYHNEAGVLTLLDQPVDVHGTRAPFVSDLPKNPAPATGAPHSPSQIRLGFRANKIDGGGGYYISLEHGRLVKTEF